MRHPRPVYARKSIDVAIFHRITGNHTHAYTRMPPGSRFFWAMNVRRREPQLWSSDGHGQPVLALVRPGALGDHFVADNPTLPPKGVLP